ncbi:hypothetical protein AB0J35_36395 [Nonomuraea angiospora]|uniref:hypothetical protein n=1 Tax=Nonomuraea angiospora TaxID=46172 RepID=UPI00343AE69D
MKPRLWKPSRSPRAVPTAGVGGHGEELSAGSRREQRAERKGAAEPVAEESGDDGAAPGARPAWR